MDSSLAKTEKTSFCTAQPYRQRCASMKATRSNTRSRTQSEAPKPSTSKKRDREFVPLMRTLREHRSLSFFLFRAYLFILCETRIAEGVARRDVFTALLTYPVLHGLEADDDLMVLREPGEQHFFPMNTLFHVRLLQPPRNILIPYILFHPLKKSCYLSR